jgi:type VI secretion system secreted protein Hcp
MPAFVKMGDIKGEATDEGHKDWIIIDSLSAPIFRSIPQGAKDQQRTKGETMLGDVVVVRQLDKSSTKLQEACASGKFFPEVEVHFCTTVKAKQEPYLKYKLKDVIVTSYSFHGNASGDPLPSEEVTLGFTEAEWTYVIVDPKTGDPKGNVPAKYAPGTGKAG